MRSRLASSYRNTNCLKFKITELYETNESFLGPNFMCKMCYFHFQLSKSSGTPRRSPRLADRRGTQCSGSTSKYINKNIPVKRKLIDNDIPSRSKTFKSSNAFIDAVTSNLDNPPFAQYAYKQLYDGDNCFIEVTRKNVDIQSTAGGPLAVGRVIIYHNGTALFNIVGDSNMINLPQFNTQSQTAELDKYLSTALDKLRPEWKFCGGIPEEEFKELSNNIRYTPSLKESVLLNAKHSRHCLKWFKSTGHRVTLNENSTARCGKCSDFARHVRRLNKRNSITPDQKLKRLQSSSFYNVKLLSPKSRTYRQNQSRRKLVNMGKKLQRLEKRTHKYNVKLNDEQHKEMIDVVRILNDKYRNDIQSAIESARTTSAETEKVLQDIWDRDTKDREDFFKDQTKNKTGYRGNNWSTITYRMALAVYTKSPAAYESLKCFKILQLPSAKSLSHFLRSKLHEPGVHNSLHEYVKDQEEKYVKYKEELHDRGKPVPLHEGIIIFDEVKVTGKVKWNSKNDAFYGLEMNPEDFSYLFDIYEELDPNRPPQPAQYMLQFLWRDVSSDFDIIGPYFASARSLEHTFIISCLYQTMRLFQAYNFHVIGLICDGASSNLAAIKMLCRGRRGAYGKRDVTNPGEDKHEIKASFINPFNPALNVHCCICPSHQLKNHINALFQSRVPGGTKLFSQNFDSPYFGWKAIQDLYKREMDRAEAGQLRFVPRLRYSYVERDAWIKLSVLPAKIMQQTAVLRELDAYLHPANGIAPHDYTSVTQSLGYLKACNALFENGYLSHNTINDVQSPVLASIAEGYTFFRNWFDTLDSDGRPFNPTNSTERRFIAWQTWDLLRVMYYGFTEFCEDFLRRHGNGYYITPLKWNGSAIETVFSQLKSITGGKLDSTNYATARKMFLTRRDILGHRPTAAVAGYRDVPLYVRQLPLARR